MLRLSLHRAAWGGLAGLSLGFAALAALSALIGVIPTGAAQITFTFFPTILGVLSGACSEN